MLRLLGWFARPLVRRRAATIRRILYIKPDHLGDLLLATPALAALRLRFPDARIAALVGPWSAFALRNNPDVDDLLICPFPGFERRPPTTDHRPPTSSLSELFSFVVRRSSLVVRPYLLLARYALLLRTGGYDVAIVGRDDHWWGAALALLAGVPQRVGFAVAECRPFLTCALPWDPRDHVTAQGLALVEVAGRPTTNDQRPTTNDQRPTTKRSARDTRHAAHDTGISQFSILNSQFYARFDPSPADLVWAEGWLAAQGISAEDQLVVLHPGTGGPAKLWRAERWAAVADALVAAGARLVLTGGPGEEPLVEDVASLMQVRPPTLAGQTTVGQLAALLRRSALTLGVDSGPLHLASAQGVPTIHLYGPGDAGRFGPWGDPGRHNVVRAELSCSPCGVFSACPRGLAQPECMSLIDVATVTTQARRLLEAQDRE